MTHEEITVLAGHRIVSPWVMKLCMDVAAAQLEKIQDEFWDCVQSDLEHGVKSLSEKAAKDFTTSMPELSKFGSWLNALGDN